jgi:hypothetical protein
MGLIYRVPLHHFTRYPTEKSEHDSDRAFPQTEGPRWTTNPDQSPDDGEDILTFEPMHLQAGEEHEKNSEKWLKKLFEEEGLVVRR